MDVRYMKIAVNASILVNEINKAYKEKRYPVFPSGVLSEYSILKLFNYWKFAPFMIVVPDRPCHLANEGGNYYIKKISVLTDEVAGYINLCFTDNAEISDMDISLDLNMGTRTPEQIESFRLNVNGPRSPEIKTIPNIKETINPEKRWIAGGSIGYGIIIGREDTGYGLEANAGYIMSRRVSLLAAVGLNQYKVHYEIPVQTINKQYLSTRLGAMINPYRGFIIEAGIIQTFGDFSAFGVTTGLGYTFLGHISLTGRYYYYGKSVPQMATISIGYVF